MVKGRVIFRFELKVYIFLGFFVSVLVGFYVRASFKVRIRFSLRF